MSKWPSRPICALLTNSPSTLLFGETTMPDADLVAALKMAKGGKKMFFAFVPKGGSDGQLIVSKMKIPPKQVADTKKQIGGGSPVTGKCFAGDGGVMVFQVAKAAPPAMVGAVKKVVKRDAA